MIAQRLPNHSPKWSEALTGYLFILPTFIGFTLFILYPIVESVRISFMDYSILRGSEYIGLENYIDILGDRRVRTVYGNTVVFTLFAVFFNAGVGLLLAVVLNRRMPVFIRNLYRSIFFFPLLVAHTYIAVIWRFLYQKDTGVINYYLGEIGIAAVPWLSQANWAMTAIIILDVWKNTGFAMLVFLAGLQNIPHEFYESAQLDGANERQIFFRITLPLLSPTIFFILVLFMIGALQVFDTIMVLTEGGPGDATYVPALELYYMAMRMDRMGVASAIGMILFVIILGGTILNMRFVRSATEFEA